MKLEINMQIEIQARNFFLTQAIQNHVERRLDFALSTRHEHIQRILVRLSDINGPRGGVDKRCLIEVRIDGLSSIVIQDVQNDLYIAIDRVAGRAARSVLRRLQTKIANGATTKANI